MKRRLALFIPLIVFGVMAGFFWRGLSLDPNAMPSALVDKRMPDFRLPIIEQPGVELTRADLDGKAYLLNVWATWCPTCRHEHPYLVKLAQQGVPIYGVDYKDDIEKARKWLVDLGNPYQATLIDADGRLGIDLGVFGAPETYLVDKQGIIRYKHVGVVDDKVWNQTLLPLYQQYR